MLLLLVAVVVAEDILAVTISGNREGNELQDDDKDKGNGNSKDKDKGKGTDKEKSTKGNEKSGNEKGKPEKEKEIILNGFIGKLNLHSTLDRTVWEFKDRKTCWGYLNTFEVMISAHFILSILAISMLVRDLLIRSRFVC